MPLSPEDRTELLTLAPQAETTPLGPSLLSFARLHRLALIDELTAVPGVAQLRAIAVRLVDALATDPAHRTELLAAAARAVVLPLDAGAPAALARHPSWIGLCALELADAQGDWADDPVERAVELAGAAFATTGAGPDLDDGEVLWAMAEQAGDAGWSRRADALLERALEAPFADPVHRAQVRLLAAMRRDERGEPAAHLLALVVDDEQALDRDRVHAAWILAHLRQADGDRTGALAALETAAEVVDRDEDPEVARRIDATRAAWARS